MITTNGHPKMGNHMLVKAVQLLGVPCAVEHIEYAPGAITGPHIFIKRDPRNVLCSWLRFYGHPLTQGMFITCLQYFDKRTFVESLAAYEGWLSDPDTLVVRFEDLWANDACMRQIAVHLGVPYLEDAFPALPGGTMSWSGQHSDYNSIWSPIVEQAWVDAGGPALLTRWGY